ADLDGDLVPPVLLSGDHEKIRKWRLEESLRATLRYRPDLLRDRPCTPKEQAILERIRKEQPKDD
ncbi:MAG: tRNA (guanosine(37)-N1)-methyltransferase TrmD, partial [Firmicutes bacterium]|nr:tRNA (guanosine(37)-N1)-methyltransferase TrmD [Bacillota bacterium]